MIARGIELLGQIVVPADCFRQRVQRRRGNSVRVANVDIEMRELGADARVGKRSELTKNIFNGTAGMGRGPSGNSLRELAHERRNSIKGEWQNPSNDGGDPTKCLCIAVSFASFVPGTQTRQPAANVLAIVQVIRAKCLSQRRLFVQ